MQMLKHTGWLRPAIGCAEGAKAALTLNKANILEGYTPRQDKERQKYLLVRVLYDVPLPGSRGFT